MMSVSEGGVVRLVGSKEQEWGKLRRKSLPMVM